MYTTRAINFFFIHDDFTQWINEYDPVITSLYLYTTDILNENVKMLRIFFLQFCKCIYVN